MQKSLLLLATALTTSNAFNLADAFSQGSCYVYSTVYKVTTTKKSTIIDVSTISPSPSSVVPSSAIVSSSSLASSSSTLPIADATSPAICPLDLPYSCTNTTSMDDDLCCFESPGGVLLATQFWDYDPSTGPSDSWTIHGLWPDNCDGTYSQYCDTSMEITDPSSIVGSFDKELLSYMQTYWKDYTGDDESLWEHEFNKHGTCYSTLKASCYGENMTAYQNVYEYYKQSVFMFEENPTYQWLSDAGIVPSSEVTYAKSDILEALSQQHGAIPYIACDSTGAIQEVWYYYHVRGPIIGGHYIPIETLTTSGCSDDVKYPPKQLDTAPTSTHTTDNPLATAPTTKGYITLSDETGCLIKNGKWYSTGTCATYSMIQLSTGSVYLESSAGYCTIEDNTFTCSSDVTEPFEFNYDSSANVFSANGVTTFSAAQDAVGQVQEPVSLGSGAVEFTLQFSTISS